MISRALYTIGFWLIVLYAWFILVVGTGTFIDALIWTIH